MYKQLNSGPITLSRANNPEGYVAPTIREREDGIDASLRHGMSFCYYIKDHLGNIREVYSSCKMTHVDFATLDDDGNPIVINQYNTPLTCIQRMQYYPSGLPWADCYHADEQPIKYNGKEFVEMHGLDEYDSKARWYYPAIMRTTTMDPLCEKYYDISPYAWCGNNPVKYVDPDGMDWYEADGEIKWTDYKSQLAMDEANFAGKYLGKAAVIFNGFYDEKLGKGNNLFGEGAKLATATVYGPNGENDITTYDAFTMSSNYDEYGAIKNGDYSMDWISDNSKTPFHTNWAINNKGKVDCIDNDNKAWGKHPETHPYSATQKDRTYVHRSNNNGDMLPVDKSGVVHPVSTGCIIIVPSRIGHYGWNEFCEQLHGVKHSFLRINRL